jgi:ubiquitin-conjugating enzyme E2 O
MIQSASEGFVADIRPTSVEVSWLAPMLPATAGNSPPFELDQDILQSGEVHIVDRMRMTATNRRLTETQCIDPAFFPGDCVRFRDISGAAVKYQGLKRVPRTESLGFDINVFMVAKTITTAIVRWQDNTTSSSIMSTALVPYLDMAESGDVWPGDLVEYLAKREVDQDVIKAAKVGIVQSADARSRLAKVRWFDEADISYTFDGDLAQLLPGSSCGALSTAVENMSFYEIAPVPGFERRIGDFVCFVADDQLRSSVASRPELQDFVNLLAEDETNVRANHDLFGEVLELGLDGLLIVRLIGAVSIRDIKVPWDGTLLVSTASQDDDDEMDLDDEFDDYSDGTGSSWDSDADGYTFERRSHALPGVVEDLYAFRPWLDEDENAVDSDGWTDEEEEEDLGDDNTDTSEGPEDEDRSMNHGVNSEKPDESHEASEDATMPDIAGASPSTTLPPPRHSTFTYDSFDPSQSESFAVLDTPVPSDHAFVNTIVSTLDATRMRRIQKEHKILRISLPAGVWVRTWESRIDLARVLMLGPVTTPYEYAPFVIDLCFDTGFPHEAPKAFFHSWTRGGGPVNPNLYQDGKICLSLLGTWPGDSRNETWGEKSTVLQILVSILGLVLVKMPYYNEAGYDVRQGTVEAQIPAALYSEKAYFMTRGFISYALTQGVPGFDDILKQIYSPSSDLQSPQLLRRAIVEAIEVARRSVETSEEQPNHQFRVSAGALIPLKREIEGLLEVLRRESPSNADALTAAFRNVDVQLPKMAI